MLNVTLAVLLACFLLSMLTTSAAAQNAALAPYTYTLRWGAPNEHTYYLELETAPQAGAYTDFRIPAWRPGRYILQNFAAGVWDVQATDASGNALPVQKADKDTWRVTHADGGPTSSITLRYRVYANVIDAGSAYVGENIAYFNGAGLFMYVPGRLDAPCVLNIPALPAEWEVATALHRNTPPGGDKAQAGAQFRAASYHELIDSPTLLAQDILQWQFEAGGIQCHVHFYGGFMGKDAERDFITDNLQRIVAEQAAIFGEPPFKVHHFIYYLVPFQMRHAVEHSYSSMYALPREVTQSTDALRSGLLPITSHEFWHCWNVKRIRPAALWPYQYEREAYTGLHWFTEGCTNYYEYLTMVRSGVITQEYYFKLLGNLLTSHENKYAHRWVAATECSYDSWLTGSRYAHPHLQTSFYNQGERIGLLLDMELRRVSKGKVSLDDVFRYLYQNNYQQNLGVPEDGPQRAAEALTGQSFQAFFDAYVYGTQSPDYVSFFAPIGIAVKSGPDPAALPHRVLGIERLDKSAGVYAIAAVIPESDAFVGGLDAGDVLVSIGGVPCADQPLDKLFAAHVTGAAFDVQVIRNGALRTFSLQPTGKNHPVKITLSPAPGANALREAWLKPYVAVPE